MIEAKKRSIYIDEDQFNPIFLPYLYAEQSTQLFTGNRGSGKSQFVYQKAVMFAICKKYFRLIYCRKVSDTLRESVFQGIKDVIHGWGLEQEFKILESSMDIVHLKTGNMMISHGLDKPEKLKSISNPTHVLVEEMTETNFADYAFLQSVLRTTKAKTQFWGLFNPEHNFWGREFFFADPESQHIPLGEAHAKTENTLIFKASFEQNPFIDREAYRKKLEALSAGDQNYLTVWIDGDWGVETVGDPFCLTFDKAKHVGETVWNRNIESYLSFDYNINPITVSLFQHGPTWIKGIESIKLANSNIYNLCEHIKMKYPGAFFIVTGDATGQARSAMTRDDVNYYTIIKSELNLSNNQLRVSSVNPVIKENRVLVNAAFQKLDIKLDPIKCKDLIFDLTYVSVDDMGKIEKGSRSDPKKRADFCDGFRYYISTFHRGILKE